MTATPSARPGNEAIIVDDVSKVFRISTTPVTSLKERLLGMGRNHYEEFPALHDVGFTIEQGETVGILGHNGSGKSTLLKCIAGILTPTSGQVFVRGRLASLLELGAGFHPDLTGRENVFINAAFLGMPRKEIAARFDEIVDFAGLEQFIDEPVKHYSSGMYVRLGFAVAVNLDPDVLLVDEVLAVGDEVFQLKCMSRIKQFQDEGRTIVLVTHAAETVRQVCGRAIVLDHGNMVIDDEPGKAIRVFREYLHGHPGLAIDSDALVESPLTIGDVQVHRSRLQPATISFTLLAHEVGMGRTEYDVDRIRAGSCDRGHGIYDILDALARSQQSERKDDLFSRETEFRFGLLRLEERELRNSMSDDINLCRRHAVDRAEQLPALLGHNNYFRGSVDDALHHRVLDKRRLR